MADTIKAFYEKVQRVADISQAVQALEWDQQVMMPAGGAEQRAHQMAALAAVLHEKVTDPALGEDLAALEAESGLDEFVGADVRETRRVRDRALKLPARLVAERAEATSLAQEVWAAARAKSDFEAFRPSLERVLSLTRDMACALDDSHPYDALLEEYEPGTTEDELQAVFADLKRRLLPLLGDIADAGTKRDNGFLRRCFPRPAQETFCRRVIGDMGFDLTAGRFDVSVHPFTNGTFRDVRLTTRYREDFLPAALFGAIHEAGHGLYEQGLDPRRYRNPSGGHCSMGIHESQSRFWENIVGRSRPFWTHYYPLLGETFPGLLDDVPLDAFYAGVNAVTPSLVRVEADEVTYNLHILLRFEIEGDLLAGRLAVKDLPALWNARMKEYLGVEPPDDRLGVLQDVHWSAGLIGYFPTYTLGNLYAAQFLEQIRRDLPDLDERLARGELGSVRAWLNGRIHVHGRRWPAGELCRQVTGEALSAAPLIRHLRGKYEEIYNI